MGPDSLSGVAGNNDADKRAGGARNGLFRSSGGGLETIIVTAEKRAEDIQKVPMNIQALTAEKLEELHLEISTILPEICRASPMR